MIMVYNIPNFWQNLLNIFSPLPDHRLQIGNLKPVEALIVTIDYLKVRQKAHFKLEI